MVSFPVEPGGGLEGAWRGSRGRPGGGLEGDLEGDLERGLEGSWRGWPSITLQQSLALLSKDCSL